MKQKIVIACALLCLSAIAEHARKPRQESQGTTGAQKGRPTGTTSQAYPLGDTDMAHLVDEILVLEAKLRESGKKQNRGWAIVPCQPGMASPKYFVLPQHASRNYPHQNRAVVIMGKEFRNSSHGFQNSSQRMHVGVFDGYASWVYSSMPYRVDLRYSSMPRSEYASLGFYIDVVRPGYASTDWEALYASWSSPGYPSASKRLLNSCYNLISYPLN